MLYGLDFYEPIYGQFDSIRLFKSFHFANGDIVEDGPSVGTKGNLASWIANEVPATAVGGIRLILVSKEFGPGELLPHPGRPEFLPFSSHAEFVEAMRNMHLASTIDSFLGLSSMKTGFVDNNADFRFIFTDPDQDDSQTWVMRTSFTIPDKMSLMVSYHSRTNMVSVFGTFTVTSRMLDLTEAVRSHKEHTCHAMLVPSLIASSFCTMLIKTRCALGSDVYNLEKNSGVREFSGELTSDYLKNTRAVIRSGVTAKARLLDLLFHLRAFDTCVLDPLMDATTAVEQSAVGGTKGHDVAALILPCGRKFRDRIVAMKRDRIASLHNVEGLIAKTDTTLGALYNIFAQADSKTNLKVAEESVKLASAARRDSSSMKSIAVLTTLFLPGTFVAAILSMPTVNWTPPEFWRYWVITIPLTLLTMGTWSVYMFAMNRINKTEVKKAVKTWHLHRHHDEKQVENCSNSSSKNGNKLV